MAEVTGKIENLVPKKSASNDSYTIVDIEGEEQGFFDWDGHVAAAGVSEGDTVRAEFSEGEYPRVQSIEKLASGNGRSRKGKEQKSETTWRDVQIARQCALKAAACVVQDAQLEYQERASEIVAMAERLEQCVLR